MAGFSIISLEPEPIPYVELADIYIKTLHVVKGTARTKARRARYFILDDAGREETIAIYRALRSRRYEVLVIPPEKQVEMGRPLESANVDAEADAFCYTPELLVEYRMVPWQSALLIVAADFKETVYHAKPNRYGSVHGEHTYGGIDMPKLSIRPDEEKVAVSVFDMVFVNPGLHLRVNFGATNWDYLRDRRQTSSTKNFKLFLDDIAQYGPNLYMADVLSTFVTDRGRLDLPSFESRKKYEEYIRWNILCIVMGADPPHGPKPGNPAAWSGG